MKTIPIPAQSFRRIREAYNALMRDDLPIDFDKVSELIQAVGQIVRAVEVKQAKGVIHNEPV